MAKTPSIVRVARPLLRHIDWAKLALDALLLAAVGMIAALVMLIVSQTVVDATAFHAGLNYSSVAAASESDAAFDVTADVWVARSGASGGAAHSDLEHSVSVTGWSYAEAMSRENIAHLLGSNVLAGDPESEGIIVDQATAKRLGAEVGETIYLDALDTDELTECPETVAAIVRPYRDPDQIQAAGLVIFPSDSCGPIASAATAQVGYNVDSTGTHHDGTTKADFTFRVLLAALAPQASGALVPLLALSLLFWGITTVRVAMRLRAQLADVTRVLHEQGVALRRLRGIFGAGLIVLCSGIGLVSITAAHLLLFGVASFWTQWLQVWILTALLALSSVLIAAITYRSARWVAQEAAASS